MNRSARRNAAKTLREIAAVSRIDFDPVHAALLARTAETEAESPEHPFLTSNRRWLQCKSQSLASREYRRA